MKLPWHALRPEARRGLVCHAFYWQAMAMAAVFFNVYLFRLSHGYQKPALYQIIANCLIPAGFALGSAIARRVSSAAAYRAGLAAYAVWFSLVLALREECVNHLGLVGTVSGLAAGLYWQGWILLMVDLSEDATRDAMVGSQQWVHFAAHLTGAPLAGYFLAHYGELDGYLYVFVAAALLLAGAWALSLPLRTRPMHGVSALRRLMAVRKPEGWGAMVFSSLLMGLLSVSALFLSLLIAYDAKGDESGTGGYSWVNAAFGLAAAWFIAGHGNPRNRGRTLWLASLAVALVSLPLALNRSFGLVLLYGAGMAIALSFYNVPLFATHLRVISGSPRFHFRRADALTLREVWINVGRVVGFAFVYVYVDGLASWAMSLFFAVIALTPLVNTWAIRKYV